MREGDEDILSSLMVLQLSRQFQLLRGYSEDSTDRSPALGGALIRIRA